MTENTSPQERKSIDTSSAGESSTPSIAVSSAGTRSTPHKAPYRTFTRTSFQNDVAALRAEGMSVDTVAKLLDVSERVVYKTQALPEVRERIKFLRSLWEQKTHEKITGLADKAMALVEKQIDEENPKGFDQAMRGVSNMERMSASVAGVERKVEVTGMAPQVDVKAVIMQLFGNDGPDR